MVRKAEVITKKSQIKIAKAIWRVSETAIAARDYRTLMDLSQIAEGLQASTGDSYVNFFDLGEYLYDTGYRLKANIHPSDDAWDERLRMAILSDFKNLE